MTRGRLPVAPYIGDSGIQPIGDHFFKLGGNLSHTSWSGHFLLLLLFDEKNLLPPSDGTKNLLDLI
jgi:hypothetical protein